jgi:hypothetical protein
MGNSQEIKQKEKEQKKEQQLTIPIITKEAIIEFYDKLETYFWNVKQKFLQERRYPYNLQIEGCSLGINSQMAFRILDKRDDINLSRYSPRYYNINDDNDDNDDKEYSDDDDDRNDDNNNIKEQFDVLRKIYDSDTYLSYYIHEYNTIGLALRKELQPEYLYCAIETSTFLSIVNGKTPLRITNESELIFDREISHQIDENTKNFKSLEEYYSNIDEIRSDHIFLFPITLNDDIFILIMDMTLKTILKYFHIKELYMIEGFSELAMRGVAPKLYYERKMIKQVISAIGKISCVSKMLFTFVISNSIWNEIFNKICQLMKYSNTLQTYDCLSSKQNNCLLRTMIYKLLKSSKNLPTSFDGFRYINCYDDHSYYVTREEKLIFTTLKHLLSIECNQQQNHVRKKIS